MAALERRPPPDTAPLSDAIRRLQADIARLAERPAADPALSAEIQRLLGMVDALTRRLAETETAMRDNRLRDRIGERALVAATALRAAAERGGSFASELETARAALAEDPAAKEAVESLAPMPRRASPMRAHSPAASTCCRPISSRRRAVRPMATGSTARSSAWLPC